MICRKNWELSENISFQSFLNSFLQCIDSSNFFCLWILMSELHSKVYVAEWEISKPTGDHLSSATCLVIDSSSFSDPFNISPSLFISLSLYPPQSLCLSLSFSLSLYRFLLWSWFWLEAVSNFAGVSLILFWDKRDAGIRSYLSLAGAEIKK